MMKSEEVKNMKPKIKSKMDYIDRVMNMTPQLYEICVKVFENDVEKLKEEEEREEGMKKGKKENTSPTVALHKVELNGFHSGKPS